MMSQPALGLDDRLSLQDGDGLVVGDVAVADDAVMPASPGVNRSSATSQKDAELGHRPALIAETKLRQMRLLPLIASAPSGSLRAGSIAGKIAMSGMPSPAASPAASTSDAIEWRNWPGIVSTGARPLSSWTKTGQIKSPAVSTFSATSLRDQASRRLRRRRDVGYRGR